MIESSNLIRALFRELQMVGMQQTGAGEWTHKGGVKGRMLSNIRRVPDVTGAAYVRMRVEWVQ